MLHQSMQWLIIRASLLTRERKNEALKSYVADAGSDQVREGVVPRPGPAEVPSTFEGVGVELRKEQGSAFLLFYYFGLYHSF